MNSSPGAELDGQVTHQRGDLAWAEASSAEIGSSPISSRGRAASARAMRDALPLPAGELVRVAAARHAGPGRRVPAARRVGARRRRDRRPHAVGDLLAHAAARVERGVRVLEHHLDARQLRGRGGAARAAVTGRPSNVIEPAVPA